MNQYGLRRWARLGWLPVWLILLGSEFGRVGATEPRAPGLNELVIHQPGTHAEGLPAVEFRTEGNGRVVDVPPVVHVHRFYYDGNKEYQGPFVSGGPTMIVANHPKTGEKVYIEATLPAGFPEISYDRNGITYIYPDRRVVISYSHHHPHKAFVKYEPGRGAGKTVHERAKAVADRLRTAKARSELVRVAGEAGRGVSQAATGAAKSIGNVAAAGVETAGRLVTAIPGVSQIQQAGQQRGIQARDTLLKSASDRAARAETEFAPTVR